MADLVVDGVTYPVSDGLPMGETPFHVRNISFSIHVLERVFLNEPLIFIAGNMFLYYEQGDPRRHVSPDVMVSRGVPRYDNPLRQSYLTWAEGKMVDFIVEFTSASAVNEDIGDKMELYLRLGLQEYFLFDPLSERLNPSLQGFRRVDDEFVPIDPVEGRLPSEVLGLHLEEDDWILRYYDPNVQAWLPIPQEEAEGRLAAENVAQENVAATLRERQAREQAEAAKAKAEAGQEKERQAREQAEATAEQERQAREQLESEMQKLREQIEAMNRQQNDNESESS